MDNDFMMIISSLEKDKGIEKDILLNAIRESIDAVTRKTLELDEDAALVVNIDENTGKISVFTNGEEIPTEKLGRIAAQTAKQVIIQKMREAETDVIYESYKDKVGELVNGVIQRFERGNIIMEVGRAEAYLPREEQVFRDDYKLHDRLRAYVVDIQKTRSNLRLVVSRTNIALVKKLFEFEVPEIAEGTVEIRGIVREAGNRTKIAVHSEISNIDCVGACVGMKGSRVKSIVNELRGEKVDIVRWDESPEAFIRNALSPAEISKLILNYEDRTCRVIVPKDKLSLAIGKKGQNARLAAKLTEWSIDIKGEEGSNISEIDKLFKNEMDENALEDRMQEAIKQLSRLEMIDESLAQKLVSSGFTTLVQVAVAEAFDLTDGIGINEEMALQMIEAAQQVAEEPVKELATVEAIEDIMEEKSTDKDIASEEENVDAVEKHDDVEESDL